MANKRVTGMRTRSEIGSTRAQIESATGRWRTPGQMARLRDQLNERDALGEPLRVTPALAAELRALGVRV